MQRNFFLHVDLDAFFASVEQLDNPEYRNKPVIVGGFPGDRRSVVSTCSYEARRYGVHSAMPTVKAKKLCPNGIFLRGRMKRYHEISYQVMSIFKDFSPDVQQMSVDEAFIDLTGTEKLFGPPEETALKLKERVRTETGLTVSAGLAANRYVAKIASGISKPDGFFQVKEGEEEDFMLSLPLDKLWGAGTKTRQRLNSFGFFTMKDIHRASISTLTTLFGSHAGNFLYNAVRGKDVETFSNEAKSHSISAEQTFPFDLTDTYIIETELLELSYDVFFRLLKENCNGKTVQVKIRYEDFITVTVSGTYPRNVSTSDDLFEKACGLFRKKYEAGRGIRLLGLAVQNLSRGMEDSQGELFDFGEEKKKAVEKAVYSMQKKDKSLHVRKARNLINKN
ncbi:MAG: DNA polymerase IV [Treponemataceae bacterium]|nr:DNA polymerase IV [Treponemataceae bacterium]